MRADKIKAAIVAQLVIIFIGIQLYRANHNAPEVQLEESLYSIQNSIEYSGEETDYIKASIESIIRESDIIEDECADKIAELICNKAKESLRATIKPVEYIDSYSDEAQIEIVYTDFSNLSIKVLDNAIPMIASFEDNQDATIKIFEDQLNELNNKSDKIRARIEYNYASKVWEINKESLKEINYKLKLSLEEMEQHIEKAAKQLDEIVISNSLSEEEQIEFLNRLINKKLDTPKEIDYTKIIAEYLKTSSDKAQQEG